MTQDDLPATAPPRAGRGLGAVALIVLGYLVLLLAMRFAYNAPDVVSDAEPTCDGRVMAADATCTETRREFIQRTGRISWYADREVTLTYDEKVAEQDEQAQGRTWFLGMAIGTAGLVVIFLGTTASLEGRPRHHAVYVGTAALLPLLAATAFVAWAETRFPGELRPGVFVWREPDGSAAGIVMLGLVALGSFSAIQGAGITQTPDVQIGGRGTFAGFALASWLERAIARAIDFVVVYISLFIVSIVIGIVTFVAGRPLLGEETAGQVMTVSIWVLACFLPIAYDTQIAKPQKKDDEANTLGKRIIGLRVLPQVPATPEARHVTHGAAWLRGLLWWGPIYLAAFATTGFGIIDPIPYGFLLLALPLLNLVAPLVDRRRRRSFADRFARTVVVRAKTDAAEDWDEIRLSHEAARDASAALPRHGLR